MTNRYPLALERIVRGLTRVTLNPATILISLNNHFVHCGWLVKVGSDLSTFGSTHGGLDDLNSDGILLSNFTPTHDTASDRVAGLFDDFPGLRNFRARGHGAEWVTKREQVRTRIARDPFDRVCQRLPPDDVFLRVWSPQFDRLDTLAPLEVTIKERPRFADAQVDRADRGPVNAPELDLTFNHPVSFSDPCADERVYALPPELVVKAHAVYRISGWLRGHRRRGFIFEFDFDTNDHGRPAAY
ncbi:MAG: hypothetical protein KGJ60_08920 [Verrucomicrobiota bacterium]|nr:hypothetical protein [Verrucomicrobiota bacterium]